MSALDGIRSTGDAGHGIDIRSAKPPDHAAIGSLLRACDLPDEDIGEHLPAFIVADLDGRIVGTAGLEVLGRSGLLRSLAVADGWRDQGLGSALLEAIVRRAQRQQIRRLWLLTTTAREFFTRFGFRAVDRTDVPAEVRATREFRSLCPANAVCMTRRTEEILSCLDSEDPSRSEAVQGKGG